MRNRSRLAMMAGVALLPATAVAAYAAGSERATTTVAPAATRDVLAQVVDPAGAKGRTLALSKVVIPAHTALALHRHPGNQIAYIERGTLTYTVRTGVVKVYRGPADDHPKVVRSVRAGQTGSVHTGEWVVERPGDVHFGANNGSGKVVILLATLFTDGSPASIPVTR
ncbi:MAG: Cupin 2 conserved barrel domain protein [Solirubrobacterales bacterium]|nr:Cupin 2 conserved barrel domain protein [Solirubrobacterales bacterium]